MTAEKKRQAFPPKLKKEAVALATTQLKPLSQPTPASRTCIAGVQGISGERLTYEEGAELAKLRREVKELRMEREILKKARAFLAKEMK